MVRLDSRDADFAAAFARLLSVKREISEDVDETVRGIIAGVVAGGDAALVDYTRRFDRFGEDFTVDSLRVTPAEIEAAAREVLSAPGRAGEEHAVRRREVRWHRSGGATIWVAVTTTVIRSAA